jgi:hypothetical protein
MGTYVSIRGWIECSEEELPQIRSIISSFVNNADDYGLTRDGAEMYNKGWVIPDSHINWTHYIFYGADIRIQCLEYIKDQLKTLSKEVYEIDGKYTDYLYGIFHVDDEEEKESYVWTICESNFYEKRRKI